MTKQCLFFWNGQEADGGGNFTLQPGIAPSAAVLRFRLGYKHRETGTLTVTDGYQRRDFQGCRVARHMVTGGEGGRWREVTILDRRWRWGEGLGAVYGEYNRYPQHALDFENARSYQQLAAYCLDALGEINYDVSILPADPALGPRVLWDGNNPADALQELVEQLGGLVTLTTLDRVRIVRQGGFKRIGLDQRMMDFQETSEPPIVPRVFVADGGHTRIQHDYFLEAVGKEIDGANAGNFVPINDLSYKPTLGWEREAVGAQGFGGAGPSLAGAAQRQAIDIARKYIYKTYRIGGRIFTSSLDEWRSTSLPIPPAALANRSDGAVLRPQQIRAIQNYFRIDAGEVWRLIPLFDKQLPAFASLSNGSDDYEVLGHFCDVTAGNNANNPARSAAGALVAINNFADIATHNANALDPSKLIEQVPTPRTSTLRVPWGSTLDTETGMITFENYTFFRDRATWRSYPALIRLRTTTRLRDPVTAAHLCQQYWVGNATANSVAVARLVKSSDYEFRYGWYGSKTSPSLSSNEVDFTAISLGLIENDRNQVTFKLGRTIDYKGFVFDHSPDGVIKAVSLDVSEQGAGTTSIDLGMERPGAYTTLDELRRSRLSTYNLWLTNEIKRKRAAGIIK